jgi:hypothetical protein
MMFCLATSSEAMEPADHKLKPVKPCTSFPPFKLFILNILSQ